MRAAGTWALVWIALWTTFASVVPHTPAIPDVALNNAIVAERLASAGARERTMLVGSSLIGQLEMPVSSGVLNLGLSAYGAATGIALVDRAARLPAVAVIETNQLLDAPDSAYAAALLAGASRRLFGVRAARLEFRPSTQAIAAVVRATRRARRLQPESGRRRAEDRLAAEWATARPDTVGRRAVARWVAARLRDWQAHGVRVLLVEVPEHALVLASAEARATRAIVDAELPPAVFPRLVLAGRDWHTSDARHLEADDARAAARALLDSLARP